MSDIPVSETSADFEEEVKASTSTVRVAVKPRPRGREVQSVVGQGAAAVDPERKHVCPVPDCGRAYKCVSSLLLMVLVFGSSGG